MPCVADPTAAVPRNLTDFCGVGGRVIANSGIAASAVAS